MRTISTIGNGIEEELSEFIEKYLGDDFKKRSVRLYAKQCGPGLAAEMTFAYSDMLINVLIEKSVIEITLGTIKDKKKSWDMHLVKSYLDFKSSFDSKDKEERRRILIFNWNIEQSTRFFIENFEKINRLFQEDRYKDTKRELMVIQRERSKLMWIES